MKEIDIYTNKDPLLIFKEDIETKKRTVLFLGAGINNTVNRRLMWADFPVSRGLVFCLIGCRGTTAAFWQRFVFCWQGVFVFRQGFHFISPLPNIRRHSVTSFGTRGHPYLLKSDNHK